MERDDLKHLHALLQHVDLVLLSHGDWQPISLASWEKDFEKHLEDRNYHQFVIEADGKPIGSMVLRGDANPRSGTGRFGIGIHDPEYVGRGYGRDALETFLDWAFRMMGFRRLKLQTLATNERALRLYEACGFQREGLLREDEYVDGAYRDIVVMGLLRSEWEARKRATVE